ncbi:Replication factor C subunit 4 [Hypsibius exemplaris]|uniref:Replication factor C subunit 4 n=1 Tax=Hypsibius exemplaris TaxID=2072580 RepID=A0A1W0X9B3_HYPEX|nr:Replication factor C subunit 4 [Hypsibius exemplaris]
MDKFLQRGKTTASSGGGDGPSRKQGSAAAGTSGKTGNSGQIAKDEETDAKATGMQKFIGVKSTVQVKKNLPWVDKYRPKTVDEIAFQGDIVAVLRNALKGEDFPHFLFYGPPGTGKTSAILAVCRELFGQELMKERILELNASDERGISVVRDKVKTFAQYSNTSIRPDGKACPPFKVIILDEADSMTGAAQAALRRIMEKESKSTRFCLICNYISRIIEPLASRCARFRFKPLPTSIIKERLQSIGTAENVQIEDRALDALISASEGDLRRAITLLQSISKLAKDNTVTREDVLELTGYIPDDDIATFLDTCKLNDLDKIDEFAQNLIFNGFGAGQLFAQLQEVILYSDFIKDAQKACIIERLAVADHRLMDGADEYFQMMDVGAVVMQALSAH